MPLVLTGCNIHEKSPGFLRGYDALRVSYQTSREYGIKIFCKVQESGTDFIRLGLAGLGSCCI